MARLGDGSGDFRMTTAISLDAQMRDALATCIGALNKLVAYEIEPSLRRRLDDLGDRKEFLDPAERDELLALVEFAQRRSIEALEAKLALSRLNEAFPSIERPGTAG
jgi:hypothetical protein